jgi:hypothetical protein
VLHRSTISRRKKAILSPAPGTHPIIAKSAPPQMISRYHAFAGIIQKILTIVDIIDILLLLAIPMSSLILYL